MKNKMTRNVILMAVVTVIMAVALSLYIQNTGTVPAADNAAKAVGKQIGRMGKMFSLFKDEFDKASK